MKQGGYIQRKTPLKRKKTTWESSDPDNPPKWSRKYIKTQKAISNGSAPKKPTKSKFDGKNPNKKSQARLKKDLDAIFSKYIRKLYPVLCYTCGKASDKLQCGHYISRQYLATRWSEKNCRPQCWGCNGYGKGQPLIFEEKLKKEYGNDFVEEMKASRHQIIKLNKNWYLEQIKKYTSLLESL